MVYSLALVTNLVGIYRVYLLLLVKSRMFDDGIFRIQILMDFAVIHLLVFFLFPVVDHGQTYYLLFVVFFLPVTCFC